MNRTVIDESRLTNKSLCGIDQPFCFPITRPWDNIIYIKPTVNQDYTIGGIGIYDGNDNLVETILEPDIYKFFSYVKALDSNGEIYFMFRQTRPFYNLNGAVNPELTCYRLNFSLVSGTASVTFYWSEPVCYIDSYTMKHYTILADPLDTNNIEYFIDCGGGIVNIYTTANMPLGIWVEYIGPFVDIFMPETCTLIKAELAGVVLGQSPAILQTFGVPGCGPYVTLTGTGAITYDCKGRYYTNGAPFSLPPDYPEFFWKVADLPTSLSGIDIRVQGGRVKTLASKTTVRRYKQSCYIPNTERVNRYKVYSMCPHPAWFIEELNIIAGAQAVTIQGTNPVADDDNVLISTTMSDDSSWKERQYSQFFYPILFFETCTCYTNYTC